MLCIGGAVVDRSYRLHAPLRPGTSNPAAGRRGFGGVACNVAENLSRLGVPVGLLSRVGDDEGGRALLAGLDGLGIDRRGVASVPGGFTAEYVAVLTPDGDLALGLADMAILDGLTPAALARHADLIGAAAWVFADCNLPAETLAALAQRRFAGAGYRLAVDAVSVAKSGRLPERLDGVDLLFLNWDEAEASMKRHGRATASPLEAVAALRAAGAGAVVLTLGPEGAWTVSAEGAVHVPAVPARVVDVTGAGDALVAATLQGITVGGLNLSEAVARGCRAAARTLECPSSADPELGRVLGGTRRGQAQGHKSVNGCH